MKVKEEHLLAELILDLKGKKRKRLDWITIAKKCKILEEKYNSIHILAGKLGVSVHLVRTIISLLSLPPEVQQHVKESRILYDAAYRLNTLKDPSLQRRVAEIIVGLPSHVQREIIQYARRFPDADLIEFRNRVTTASPRKEKVRIVLVPLSEPEFVRLQRMSKRRGVSLQDLILEAIHAFISQTGKS